MSEETIHIEEEVKDAAHKLEDTAKRWTEEITVRGGEAGETVGRLLKEAAVRKITVKSQSGKTLVELFGRDFRPRKFVISWTYAPQYVRPLSVPQ